MQVHQAWTPSLLKKRIPSLISRRLYNSRFYALCCLLVRWICFIGRPFVKRFALCHRTVVLSVCLSCLWGWCTVAKWLDGSRLTWHASRPRPRRHCVRWGLSSSPPTKGAQPPIFVPCLLWPNDWMDEDATWYGNRRRPKPHGGRGLSSAAWKDPAVPLFLADVYCGHGCPSQLLLSSCLC